MAIGDSLTQAEFRRARKNGWRVMHKVGLHASEDIDSIALSTAGLVVVETKWSASDLRRHPSRSRVEAAAKRAAANAQLAKNFLKHRTGELPVWPVVVVWPSRPNKDPEEHDGVTIVPGLAFDEWISSLPKGAASAEAVERGWALLDAVVTARLRATSRRFRVRDSLALHRRPSNQTAL